MNQRSTLAQTIEQMIEAQEPNLLRLYLNPHVAQTCFCLDRYARETWPEPRNPSEQASKAEEAWQSFLANSQEEAVSGAIKLARFARFRPEVRATGLVVDPGDRLATLLSVRLSDGSKIEFLPGVHVLGSTELGLNDPSRSLELAVASSFSGSAGTVLNPLVLVADAEGRLDAQAEGIRELIQKHAPVVITCVCREALARVRAGDRGIAGEILPDILVFDESFVEHDVPFASFTARERLFSLWNRPGKSTFHSTTFQPNTISTRHFMNCLARFDENFLQRHQAEIKAMTDDLTRRGEAYRRYYNPMLYRLIRAAGFATMDIRAERGYVVVNGRSIFDVVGGVACSIRGHNPQTYLEEIQSFPEESDADVLARQLEQRLHHLTGLEHALPAVSGASAVETALKLALIARFPRKHILALKAGFGGKTLFALTGTANPAYKQQIEPLYADVVYVDPFAPDATAQIDALMSTHEFAVVQVELVQSVGGVRRIPDHVIHYLDEGRARWGYLLLVDEIQTGMYRTGPFVMSRSIGLTPDLLLLGKGTSDMMFPFALTLYTSNVGAMLASQGSAIVETIRARYGYPQGYKTVLNVLRLGEESALDQRVCELSERFQRSLTERLGSPSCVRELRVFGLLIGVEIDATRGPRRWLKKRLSGLYLLAMLRHPRFPVFAGFCQYEPNVLKITPPLNSSDDEIEHTCATIAETLKWSLPRVITAVLRSLLRSPSPRNPSHEHRNDPAAELASR